VDSLPKAAQAAEIHGPTTVIIGRVVALRKRLGRRG
jgi:siroheme synthase